MPLSAKRHMMADHPGAPRLTEGRVGILGPEELPAASSLLSSRWSRDNLVTGHPARLYDGRILERIGQESFVDLIADLEQRTGSVRLSAGRMGVFTWDIACADERGPFTLQVPLVLDEPGKRERAKSDVPRLNVENMRHFRSRGLTRFIVEPRDVLTLAGKVPAATFAALPDHHPITFGGGSIGIELAEAGLSSVVYLGARPTADLLAEMIAALVYHYDPDADGGTAVTDVCINDGDFAVKRRRDGSFELRLTAARRREGGIGRSLFLLYLLQLIAYQDWSVDGELVGLPMLASNPSVAFEGVVRGLGYRHRDLGRPPEQGPREAHRWIRDFGRSPEGRAYRPWVDRFLAGRLPPAFGGDPRERWWRLIPLQTKLAVHQMRARQARAAKDLGPSGGDDGAEDAASARALQTLLDRLSQEIGRVPDDDPAAVRVNDLGRDELLRLLEEAGIPVASRDDVAEEALAHWPHRSLDHLVAQVPGAEALRGLKSRLSFGRVVPEADRATTRSLGPPAKEGGANRPLANPEVFGGWVLPPSLQAVAARTFPTFEAYMDAALHDPQWGYYGHGVQIGETGHFDTHPESLSPHYGRWLAARAFHLWQEMLARGELSETEAFPIVEFGAGNGRLARDLLDAVARAAAEAADDPKLPLRLGGQRLRTFASRLDYRIYETSASLRDRQRELLGRDAIVGEGDARHPARTLKRDFPDGVKGLVVTNEVPDAFGVHKIVLTAEGRALSALVIPRVEATVPDLLGDVLSRRITGADEAVRRTFGLEDHAGDFYLDGATYAELMQALAGLSAERREALLGMFWFEEAYVPAAAVPELGAHLGANADQYAIALAAEASGVVLYVNVHADRFIRELGSSLVAGFIVTVDYGDTTWGLVQGARRGDFPFRVYGDWQDYVPRPNDPYTAPGTQDMTADVNFTELARAGEAAGLTMVHYGPERDLIGDDLAELVLSAGAPDQGPAAQSWTDFWGNPVFKVLVLGTRPSDVFTGPLMTPLPLSRKEQDVPQSQRLKVAALREALAGRRP
jgi:SAM-dependent MidA family methyltransferase